MALNIKIEVEDNKFRVIAQDFKTDWLPDTPENRKAVVIMLRCLQNEEGKALFTFKELAAILGSDNSQAASQHLEDFRKCGKEIYQTLKRKRKVDEEVVQAVLEILQREPLLAEEAIAGKVNEKLNRRDIEIHNVRAALEQISVVEIRKILKKQLAKGEAHYKEEHLLERLFKLALEKAEESKVAGRVPDELKEQLNKATEPIDSTQESLEQIKSDEVPEEVKNLFEGEVNSEKLSSIWNSKLGWKLWAFILYFQGVSQSVIGSWIGVDKSTICRWLKDVANWGYIWVKAQKVAFSLKVAIDEKWIKIAGEWWYLFVAVDCVTGYPLHAAIYPSNSGGYCKLFLLELKQLGYYPKVIITDGWDGYIKAILAVFPEAEHLLCRFHVIRSVFRRLRKARIFSSKIYKAVGKLFKTSYKRTVRRRIDRLQKMLQPLSAVTRVLGGLEAKLPQVIKTVGSTWRPSTSNAAEGFFCKFERFYRLKGPFCDEASAQKHLQLFLLGYLFSIGAQGQPCPLEKAGGNVAQLPFYHLINRPNIIALKERMAKQYRQAG
jgi:transposase-like protein